MCLLSLCFLVGSHPRWNQFMNCLPKDQNAIEKKMQQILSVFLGTGLRSSADLLPQALKESTELMIEKVENREMNKKQ